MGLYKTAVDILSYDGAFHVCYGLPTRLEGPVAQTKATLQSSADIIFIASCDTSTIFTGWWNMLLAEQIGGQALVIPDLDAMSALPKNSGLISVDNIDIQQGAVAWEKLVNSLAAGKTVQQAVDDANAAVASFYGTITSWPSGQLAQVIFKVFGDPNVRTK